MKRVFFCLIAFHLYLLSPLYAGQAPEERLVRQGSYAVASHSGQIITELNAHRRYIPASIFKIVTAFASLETLGENYRFPTYFYITPGIDLWIKGQGDPLLISEEIAVLAKALKRSGLREFRNLYIDDSLYELEEKTISESATNNPYDTPLSALGVNFNTINVWVDGDGSVRSAEAQTPTVAIMEELGAGLGPGEHRINVTLTTGQTQRLAAETFKAIFAQKGIKMRGTYQARKTPQGAGLFYTHYSKPLVELLPAMLLYSNNFMANQLFLTLGHKVYGPPVTWLKARKALSYFLQKKGVSLADVAIVDGAGLNRGNEITSAAMLKLLQEFRPYSHLLPLYHEQWRLKSGTMTGIYSYAGYLGDDDKAPAVVLMLNQDANNRELLLNRLAILARKNN